ncbi:MAG: dienelactone hydrolase family protein [Pseudomonadota bacterium]
MRKELEALLGYAGRPLRFEGVKTVSEKDVGSAVLHDLAFQTHDGEVAPAWYAVPKNRASPMPAILYLHAHGKRFDIGRRELFEGRPAVHQPYFEVLIEAGFAILCIEMPCFAARQTPDESARVKAHLWHGTTLFGRMIHELRCGMTFLAEQSEIDESRIGVYGLSMGGTQAYWLAALDARVACAASLCCFSDLACLIETGQHDMHGHYMVVPGLLKRFSTGKIAGLAAPTPLLICAGLQDWSSPKACFELARDELAAAYAAASAETQLYFHVDDAVGHIETPAMHDAVMQFFRRSLQ